MQFKHTLLLLTLSLLLLAPVAMAKDAAVVWKATGQAPNAEYLDLKEHSGDPLGKFAEGGIGRPGARWTDPFSGVEFVWVEGGCFKMGSSASGADDDEQPHDVCLDGFWMGRHEVTQAQYQLVMGRNPSERKGDFLPVEKVSWYDAKAFAQRLSSKGNGVFRLPTEAQWEFAARSGGRSERYPGGSSPDRVAWYTPNSSNRTHNVGSKAPNGLGIHDMAGNLWEWCEDVYSSSAYRKHARKNPVYTGSGSSRVERGGSYRSSADSIRTANRFKADPGKAYNNLGFRVIKAR